MAQGEGFQEHANGKAQKGSRSVMKATAAIIVLARETYRPFGLDGGVAADILYTGRGF